MEGKTWNALSCSRSWKNIAFHLRWKLDGYLSLQTYGGITKDFIKMSMESTSKVGGPISDKRTTKDHNGRRGAIKYCTLFLTCRMSLPLASLRAILNSCSISIALQRADFIVYITSTTHGTQRTSCVCLLQNNEQKQTEISGASQSSFTSKLALPLVKTPFLQCLVGAKKTLSYYWVQLHFAPCVWAWRKDVAWNHPTQKFLVLLNYQVKYLSEVNDLDVQWLSLFPTFFL